MTSLSISAFLIHRLQNRSEIVRSFIFGSIAKGSKAPNDCDLFIVTKQTPLMDNWDSFINEVDQLRVDFEVAFLLKLNVIINTEKEFSEYSPFKERVLNRPIIEII